MRVGLEEGGNIARPERRFATMEPSTRPMTRRRLLVLGAGTVAAVAVTGQVLRPDRERASTIPIDPRQVYDPFRAGESLPDGYLPIFGRDFIRPVYDPRFVAADDIGWPDDADVIGVEVGGDTRAYPVGFLNGREMVIDTIADVPVLVTW